MEIKYYFYFIFRFLIFFQFIFPILTTDLCQEDNDALVAFMGGSEQFAQFCTEKLVTIKQSKENLAQISGIYLGALFYLRRNKTFGLELNNPTELRKEFYENLDILYEYFYNVYAAGGQSSTVVKPKFVNEHISSYCLTTIMQNMVQIWEFELEIKSKLSKENDENDLMRKIQLSNLIFYLQLINGDELDYLPKHKHFKIDDVNEEKTRTKFDGIMEKIYKKAEEKLMEESAYNYDMKMAIQDEAFVAFVNGNNGHLANIVQMYGQSEASFNEFNSDKFEQLLALLRLMKTNWNCAKIKQKELDRACVRHRKELDRLYEYFANVHGGIEGVVKPQFYSYILIGHGEDDEAIIEPKNVPLSEVLISLNGISILIFDPDETTNAKQLHYHIGSTSSQFHEIGVKMAFDWKDDGETSATEIKRLIQHNFDQYLNDLLQKWIKKGLEKKAELDALEKQIMNDEGAAVEVQRQFNELKSDFGHHPVFRSPFFDIIL